MVVGLVHIEAVSSSPLIEKVKKGRPRTGTESIILSLSSLKTLCEGAEC